ncbi:STAS domain-containing protein [Streptomyces sp. NPDC048172]|uniref:STAS domain-containing protein n=1 Tax=Streptomyces sp. NPDC048172 TaxID=3365505 RepID=UPI00372150E1
MGTPDTFTFALRHHLRDGTLVLAFHGELDCWAERETGPRVSALLNRERSADVLVDLRGVTFLDASGLRLLLRVKEHVADYGGTLRLLRGSPKVWRVLCLARLDHAFTVLDDWPSSAGEDPAADRPPGSGDAEPLSLVRATGPAPAAVPGGPRRRLALDERECRDLLAAVSAARLVVAHHGVPLVELVGLLHLDGEPVALLAEDGGIALALTPAISPRRLVVLQADDLATARRRPYVRTVTALARPRWVVGSDRLRACRRLAAEHGLDPGPDTGYLTLAQPSLSGQRVPRPPTPYPRG